jgi:tripartite-type tricarboxylate transporter receptor subunit TctC
VVLENRPGAAGSIAATAVAAAAPDGYTLLCDSSAHATAPHLIRDLTVRYDTAFAPVTVLSAMGLLVATAPAVPANVIRALLDLARVRAKEGKPLTYGSGGNGSAPHYATVLLEQLAGIELTHVPFRGGGPAVQALIAGTIDINIATAGSAAALVQEGRIKAHAVTTKERLAVFPALPTLQEAGVAGYEWLEWGAIFVPAGTPAPIVARLQAAAAEALARPAVKERLEKISIQPVGSTPAEAAAFVAAQNALAGRLTRTAGITMN